MSGESQTLIVEGGGSRTWIAVAGREELAVEGASISIGIEGETDGLQEFRRLVRAALHVASVEKREIQNVLMAHAAASTQERSDVFANLCEQTLRADGIDSRLVVTNDMVPLLLRSPRRNVVACIAGTGTSAGGRSKTGEWARVGGLDFVLSDQGGGFDLAMKALRGVVLSITGRQASTTLTHRAAEWVGDSTSGQTQALFLSALYAKVYGNNMRTVVASFARHVSEAALDEDDFSRSLCRGAALDLRDSIVAAARKLRLEEFDVLLSGSLIGEGSAVGTLLRGELAQVAGLEDVTMHLPEQTPDVLAQLSQTVRRQASIEALGKAFPVSVTSSRRRRDSPF